MRRATPHPSRGGAGPGERARPSGLEECGHRRPRSGPGSGLEVTRTRVQSLRARQGGERRGTPGSANTVGPRPGPAARDGTGLGGERDLEPAAAWPRKQQPTRSAHHSLDRHQVLGYYAARNPDNGNLKVPSLVEDRDQNEDCAARACGLSPPAKGICSVCSSTSDGIKFV